jgi:spore coat polysaccharide biosynthesis protein SpsF
MVEKVLDTAKKAKIVAVIEARMTSSRLPGKHMLPVNGKPIIEYLIMRLKKVPSLNEIVLAVTTNNTDQPLIELANKTGISYFLGSENDVMSRVIGAADSVEGKIIVGITGDCPLIDPLIVEQTIQMFIHNSCSYVNNAAIPGYPGGMNTQVYELKTLKKSSEMTKDPLDREHVTAHIFRNPELFQPIYLMPPPYLYWPELKLELDEQVDYELLKKIIKYFGNENPYFSCKDIIELLRKKTSWIEVNKNVRRKSFE